MRFLASGSPLDHVIQHPLLTRRPIWSSSPRRARSPCSSNQIAMFGWRDILVLFVARGSGGGGGARARSAHGPTGFANFFEAVCQYLRREVAEPALGDTPIAFIKYIWSVFFFILRSTCSGFCRSGDYSAVRHAHRGDGQRQHLDDEYGWRCLTMG